MGVVYLGESGRDLVAVKVLRGELADDPDFLGRFARELSVMTRVNGLCAVRVLDADLTATPPYLVTEFVDGPSLAEQVRDSGPLPRSMAYPLAMGLAEALMAIHGAGVVHRDLKPANVLLDDTGPKVIDFGIAQAFDMTTITRTGVVMGSPVYMAPEQFDGISGPATDVYAWGTTVAYAVLGHPPLGMGSADVMAHRVRTLAPDLSGLPPELLPAVNAALQKDPRRRPTAAGLANILMSGGGAPRVASVDEFTRETLSNSWQAPPRPPSYVSPTTIPRPPRRPRPLMAVLAAAAAVLIVAGGVAAAVATQGHGHKGADNAGHTTAPPQTKVLVYQPWLESGGLSPDVKAVETVSGSCFTQSIAAARADAYRCTSGNDLYDPCFASDWVGTPRQVACPDLAAGHDVNKVLVIDLTQDLPTPPANSSRTVWLMVLKNGQACSANTGGTNVVAGLRLSYGCGNGGIYGDVDEKGSIWTADYASKTASTITAVQVATAYE
jgi:hypothetical protein